ncbi:hypothetical protein, partial [Escherichia coli]|uniref:hypothetical protein n=1 Tax=Escherichia coli TaxID=562 RepID=UPI00195B0030
KIYRVFWILILKLIIGKKVKLIVDGTILCRGKDTEDKEDKHCRDTLYGYPSVRGRDVAYRAIFEHLGAGIPITNIYRIFLSFSYKSSPKR